MDYNRFPFLCFITLGGSTTAKVFAVPDHTHSHDSKICARSSSSDRKLQNKKALHNITQPQAVQVNNLCVIWLLGGFQHCRHRVAFETFFTCGRHLSWPWTCRRCIPSSPFPTVHWSACWFFFTDLIGRALSHLFLLSHSSSLHSAGRSAVACDFEFLCAADHACHGKWEGVIIYRPV